MSSGFATSFWSGDYAGGMTRALYSHITELTGRRSRCSVWQAPAGRSGEPAGTHYCTHASRCRRNIWTTDWRDYARDRSYTGWLLTRRWRERAKGSCPVLTFCGHYGGRNGWRMARSGSRRGSSRSPHVLGIWQLAGLGGARTS
jgi:hypothetical protein